MVAAVSSSDWASFAVAAGTFALAIATAVMAKHTNATAKASLTAALAAGESAEAATETARVSTEQLREVIAARVDARSPLVVPFPGKATWPPSAEDPRLARDSSYGEVESFYVPGQLGSELWFRFQVLLKNEGNVSALIWGLNESRFVEVAEVRAEFFQPGDSHLVGFVAPQRLGNDRYLLPPQSNAVLDCVVHGNVQRWITAFENRHEAPPESKRQVTLIVGTQFDDGAVDNVTIEFQSYPIAPQAGHDGVWELRQFTNTNEGFPSSVGVAPIRRRRYVSRIANVEL